jgi:hypothetical protein
MGTDNSKGLTSKQVNPPNPTGKGGFKDNPQNRSDGAWKKTETFRYWYEIFKEMSVSEFKQWQKDNLEDTRSIASNLAFRRIFNALDDLKEFQEVADRSEGKAPQTVRGDFTGNIDIDIPEEVVDVFNEAIKQGLRRKPADRSGNAQEPADLDSTEVPNS